MIPTLMLRCAFLLALTCLGCAEAATSARPPTNVPPVPDARVEDAGPEAGGSLIAGGDPDASAAPDARLSVDVTVTRPDVAPPDAPRDAAADLPRDVAPDLAPDVPRDVGPEEVCGNGRDDNLDGQVDEDCPATSCPLPPQPRTRVRWVGGTPPPSVAQAAAALGLTVTAGAVSADALPDASVIVFAYGAPADESWRDALRAWVEGGGAVMTLVIGSGEPDSPECDPPNALLRRFGLAYSCASPVPWGPITAFFPHPLTDGLTVDDVPYVNGRGVTERPGVATAPLAEIDGQVVARAATPGCGRVVVWGDEHVGIASYGDRPLRFWRQSLAWLAGR
ncbi:MAG: hypothetical protein U0324_27530 [Polyangiales bacterium]